MRTQRKYKETICGAGKPAMITSRLVLVLHVIGLEGGPSFEHRSQSDLKQKYRNSGSSQK